MRHSPCEFIVNVDIMLRQWYLYKVILEINSTLMENVSIRHF